MGLVVAVAIVMGAARAASAADDLNGAGYNDRNVWAGYREPPSEVVVPARDLARHPTRFCLRLPPPNQEAPPTGHGTYTPAEMRDLARRTPIDLTPGSWHTLICYNIGENLPYLITFAVWNPRDPTNGNTTTIENVEAYARDLIDTPPPMVASSPPAARQITGLETWFAVASAPTRPRSAQAGPLWATAEAVARRVEIDPGNGEPRLVCEVDASLTTTLADAPQLAPGCLRHTYTAVDRRTGVTETTLRAHVVYDVYLTTSDNPTRRLADTLTSPDTVIPVTIREIQTVLR